MGGGRAAAAKQVNLASLLAGCFENLGDKYLVSQVIRVRRVFLSHLLQIFYALQML